MSEAEVLDLSSHIMAHIEEAFPLDELQTIALYYPFNNEVDLRPLIERLLIKKKKIVLPKVLSKTTMDFFLIQDIHDVSPSRFGVYEPTGDKRADQIDIMFVPGIAFNNEGYRLGYGAGFYDRFLAE